MILFRFLETPSMQRPDVKKPVKETIDFPEKDESLGEIQMAFVGPPTSEHLTRKVSRHRTAGQMHALRDPWCDKALDILALYLTDSPVAPLTKEYVEIPAPLWFVYSQSLLPLVTRHLINNIIDLIKHLHLLQRRYPSILHNTRRLRRLCTYRTPRNLR